MSLFVHRSMWRWSGSRAAGIFAVSHAAWRAAVDWSPTQVWEVLVGRRIVSVNGKYDLIAAGMLLVTAAPVKPSSPCAAEFG